MQRTLGVQKWGMQRNIGFHSLLDIWCLLQAVKNVLQITKGKIIKAWRYFSVELIFLGTSCSSNKVWFYQATHRDMLLRSCVPVFHLLSCLNPLICMFFFLPKKNLKSCVSCLLHHLAQPPLLFPSLPSQMDTQLPTLPSRLVFLLHLFWSCSWV